MRKLTDRLREEAKAAADDRDLTSRSDLRREEHARETALKQLAQRLVGMKPAQLGRLALDTELLDAITHAQALGDRKAKGRQIGVVRQQLRDQAQGFVELMERVAKLEAGLLPSAAARPQPPAPNAAVEAWVERFTREGEAALEAFFELHPEADRQALRQGARALARSLDSGLITSGGARATVRLREELERWVAR